MNTKADREEQLVLELLEAVGQKNDVSQRHLARHMGVALGLANSYLKRCIRKGFIKISEAPANRYLYYLTPTGFAEKAASLPNTCRHPSPFTARPASPASAPSRCANGMVGDRLRSVAFQTWPKSSRCARWSGALKLLVLTIRIPTGDAS